MRAWIAFVLILFAAGCASGPPAELKYSWEFYRAPAISPETFAGQSVAILPAVSITYDPTQEVYRGVLGGLLYSAFAKFPNGPKIVSLDEVQSSINKKALWSDFEVMYTEYSKTSVLRRDILSRIGQAAGARYMLLPRLLRFDSETFDRATIVGIAFLRTRQSSVNIQAQIWDTETGEVVWEGASEGTVASEVVRGSPASFMAVAQNACESIAARMPWVKLEVK